MASSLTCAGLSSGTQNSERRETQFASFHAWGASAVPHQQVGHYIAWKKSAVTRCGCGATEVWTEVLDEFEDEAEFHEYYRRTCPRLEGWTTARDPEGGLRIV